MSRFDLALIELQSIANCTFDAAVKINIARWIDQYIGEAHMEIKEYRPFDKENAKYNLQKAMLMLGETIAKKSNMYPTYETDKDGFKRKMRVSSLYFKNGSGL